MLDGTQKDEIPAFVIPDLPGAHPDPFDPRDYKAEALMGAAALPAEYDVQNELAAHLPIDDQDGSSSCTGQAWRKYAEVLELLENKALKPFSARWFYAQTYIANGGAYIRDGAALAVGKGAALESDVPSYQNGQPPNETFMRTQDFLGKPEILARARIYEAKSYAVITSKDFGMIQQAIYQNKGCVAGFVGSNAGWSQPGGIVRPPQPGEAQWGHAVYLRGWKIINGLTEIIVHNSWGQGWGDKGQGYVGLDYFANPDNIFNPWTLIDRPDIIPNPPTPMPPKPANILLVQKGIAYGFAPIMWAPNPAALLAAAKQYGYPIPTLPDGSIDWVNLKADVQLHA